MVSFDGIYSKVTVEADGTKVLCTRYMVQPLDSACAPLVLSYQPSVPFTVSIKIYWY